MARKRQTADDITRRALAEHEHLDRMRGLISYEAEHDGIDCVVRVRLGDLLLDRADVHMLVRALEEAAMTAMEIERGERFHAIFTSAVAKLGKRSAKRRRRRR